MADNKQPPQMAERAMCSIIRLSAVIPVYNDEGRVDYENTFMASKYYAIEVYPQRGIARIWSTRSRVPTPVTTASLSGAAWCVEGDVVEPKK